MPMLGVHKSMLSDTTHRSLKYYAREVMRIIISIWILFMSSSASAQNPPLEFKDLFAPVTDLGKVTQLDDWNWLIKEKFSPIFLTAFGDFIYQTNQGIYFLDTYGGNVTKIADDKASLKQMLNDDDNVDNWFMPSLRLEMHQANINLKPDQVYSPNRPTVLGGKFSVDNFTPKNWEVHYSISGQILQQISSLPEGTKINSVKLER